MIIHRRGKHNHCRPKFIGTETTHAIEVGMAYRHMLAVDGLPV
ncbi:hypothetical protein PSYJA_38743, partial [Pseudomonas syringae pv. japonica str. M301072]